VNQSKAMMLMQKAPQGTLDTTFPEKYLQKLEQYRKHQSDPFKPKRRRKPSRSPQIFSNHCKQAISMAKAKVYCCVLKELIEGALCKACPCHDPEPLEYSLFKRV